MTQLIWIVIFTVIAVANLSVSFRCLAHREREGRMLCYALRWAALVSVSYMLSILTTDQWIMSLSSSVYFASVSGMIFFLMRFFFVLSGEDDRGNTVVCLVRRVFLIWTLVDAVLLLTNPISGVVLTYQPVVPTPEVARWIFIPHRLYDMHLALCYLMLCAGFFALIMRTLRVPWMYRHYYLRIILGVLAMVAINAAYLLQVTYNHIDYSILFYSVMGYWIHWNAFEARDAGLLSQARHTILEHLGQPLFFFDWDDQLILTNESARTLLDDLDAPDHSLTVEEFLHLCGAEDQLPDLGQDRRFYWTARTDSKDSYICDFQLLRDKKHEMVGRFFILTNNTLGVDPLTGFQTQQYFNLHSRELIPEGEEPVGVAVCDLNRLALLNDTMGTEGGDHAIRLQAQAMKKHFPSNTVFVRLQDAVLCALCRGLDSDEIKARLQAVNQDLEAADSFPFRIKMDSAVSITDPDAVVHTAQETVSILRTRKLLDSDSDGSAVIDSLHQLLLECDSETEFHVRRTRELGERLSFLLGLSDYERDQLSLLCLFHDIGKVGIPQEILNRSGKLSQEEQDIMRSHAEKGYRIAKATPELNIVAEAIRHHHERWDGSGYPDGLKREAIPLLSRIIAVVDAYDAMVSDRPYRKGMEMLQACRELIRYAGIQFDPYVVEVFVGMITGGEEVEVSEQVAPEKTTDLAQETIGLVSTVYCARYTLGPKEQILEVDGFFEELTGFTSYDVKQFHLTQSDMIFEEDRELYWTMVEEQRQAQGIVYLEHRIRRKDGTGRYVYCTGLPFTDPATGELRTTVIVSDITDSVSVQMQVGIARNRAMMSLYRLEEANQRDPLTGLLNRSAFRKACERELDRDGQRCLMMMLDVDDFKGYNDTYGHPKGDELLIDLTKTLSDAVGREGLAGRMGGDEFCCLLRLERNASLSQIRRRGEEILRQVNERVGRDGVSVSAGVAWSDPKGSDFQTMYARSDKALYTAKKDGKAQLWGEEQAPLRSVT
ncbi:MAG: diguanylate cyclase [Bacillota bacterium]|nr:diguanylate cyclase [Bacillota bacterium]